MPLPEKLQAARLLASEKWPYVSTALWAVSPVEAKGLGTLAVDKWWRLYYDPDFVENGKPTNGPEPAIPAWTVEECATALYHECQHLIRKHPERAELQLGLDDRAWNVAADAEINDDIATEAWQKLPKGAIMPALMKKPDGLLAEEYYEQMPSVNISICCQGTSGGSCGSIAGGSKQSHELDGPSQAGGTSQTPGLSPAEAELVRHQIAHEVSTGRGNVPEYMKKWAKELLEPTVDWRKALRGAFKRATAEVAGQMDYTWKRMNRRQGVHKRVVLPAMMAPDPKVAIVADTSGSMGSDGGAVLSEINGILKACGSKGSRVYATDAAVHTTKKVFSASQVELIGGGGTDMGVGMAEAMKDRPHIIVVLTDGYTPWPDTSPNARVIVALINQDVNIKGPDYARTIRCDPK